jgi:hypothetical protein
MILNQSLSWKPATLPKFRLSRRARLIIVIGLALSGALGPLLLIPLKQLPQYHQFADCRGAFGIPSLLNVASNLSFLLVGLLGLAFLLKKRAKTAFIARSERWPYLAFFWGIVLTGFGSSYYHWSPADGTLVWDRLPMTMAFMAVLAAVIGERIAAKAAKWLLIPLLIAGCASVIYWQKTGNLWPYAATQYCSVFLVIVIMLLFPSRYTRGADLFGVVGIYGIAKICEMLDAPIFAVAKLVSGHTLKHIFAALAACCVLEMIRKRTPRIPC